MDIDDSGPMHCFVEWFLMYKSKLVKNAKEKKLDWGIHLYHSLQMQVKALMPCLESSAVQEK